MPYAGLNVQFLGVAGYLEFMHRDWGLGITVTVPRIVEDKLPCKWAWVLKITGVIIN